MFNLYSGMGEEKRVRRPQNPMQTIKSDRNLISVNEVNPGIAPATASVLQSYTIFSEHILVRSFKHKIILHEFEFFTHKRLHHH